MKLTHLEITSLPGIEPGFALDDIARDVNLVSGPNAVGKSSIIRALRYLVGGAQAGDPAALALRAVFEKDDERWTVRRTGREVAWERNGNTVERPPLPERDSLHCYWLSMEELLAADERDDVLARELRRALSGGYDLAALRENAPFNVAQRAGQREADTLRKAENGLNNAQREYEELRRQEKKIPQLGEDIEEARADEEKATMLAQALALLDVCGERRQIEAGLQEFPENMDRLRGDELQQFDVNDAQRRECKSEIEATGVIRDQAERRLKETGLGDDMPARAEIEACDEQLNKAARARDQRDQYQTALEQAEAKRKQAGENLGGNAETPPQLEPDSVARAETLARQLQDVETTCAKLENQLSDDCEAPEPRAIEQHTQAAAALRRWLALETDMPAALKYGLWIAACGGALTIVAALLAAAWIALLCGAAALGGAVWALTALKVDRSSETRQQFERTGVDAPTAWQRAPVEKRLDEIDIAKIELERQQAQAQRHQQLRVDFEGAQKKQAALNKEKEQLAAQLGFNPSLTAAALDRFVRLAQAYDDAANECASRKSAVERLNSEIDSACKAVSAFLGKWNAAPEEASLESLRPRLQELRDRLSRAEEARRDQEEADRALERLQNDVKRYDHLEAQRYQEAGVEPGERAELTRRIEMLPAWKEQQQRLVEASAREREKRQPLEGQQELLQLVDNNERDALTAALEQAREGAAKREELQTELTEIRTRLRDAGGDQRLERAMADRDNARAALEKKYDEALFARAATLLLGNVEQEYQTEHEPEALRNARERFKRFTHNAYDLELSQDNAFIARDTKLRATRQLRELSSATRMQLLLSVRLAWTHTLERGRESLPFFFDEALTTSDENRFAQVAQSLEMLARDEDRQIFYLSARQHEALLWERATGSAPHQINLALVRFPTTSAQPEDYALPDMEQLPQPDEHTPESYAAALGVPLVEPQQSGGAVHLFHLLRDNLPLLYHLMQNWRITTVGQLETLLGSNAAATAVTDQDWRKRLTGRCAAARAWTAAWRQGRGKCVDRIALEASECISETFMERVVELAEQYKGDGAALMAALRAGEAPRFQNAVKDQLEAWLQENGYIPMQRPLTQEEREHQTLLAASHHAAPEDVRAVTHWLEGARNNTATEE